MTTMNGLEKRVKELERALRPFARWYTGSFESFITDGKLREKLYPVEFGQFHPTVNHLREARRVIDRGKG